MQRYFNFILIVIHSVLSDHHVVLPVINGGVHDVSPLWTSGVAQRARYGGVLLADIRVSASPERRKITSHDRSVMSGLALAAVFGFWTQLRSIL